MIDSVIRGSLAALLFCAPSSTAIADQSDPRLPQLFTTLETSSHQPEAQEAAVRIWHIWTQSGDDDVDQLMSRSVYFLGNGDPESAVEILDDVVDRLPRFAEGWNRRATAHYLNGDFAASMHDIHRTLMLEPRHFGAISGMGLIFMARGDRKGALKAFEQVLQIHPWSPSARAHSEVLRQQMGTEL